MRHRGRTPGQTRARQTPSPHCTVIPTLLNVSLANIFTSLWLGHILLMQFLFGFGREPQPAMLRACSEDRTWASVLASAAHILNKTWGRLSHMQGKFLTHRVPSPALTSWFI